MFDLGAFQVNANTDEHGGSMNDILNTVFAGTDVWSMAVIVGLAMVTVLARGFFMIFNNHGNCRIGRNAVCNTHRLQHCQRWWCLRL